MESPKRFPRLLYRYLHEPEEKESICHDILAADPGNQLATRLWGLAITDQFSGQSSDRYTEVKKIFQHLSSPFGRHYCTGNLTAQHVKSNVLAPRHWNSRTGIEISRTSEHKPIQTGAISTLNVGAAAVTGNSFA